MYRVSVERYLEKYEPIRHDRRKGKTNEMKGVLSLILVVIQSYNDGACLPVRTFFPS